MALVPTEPFELNFGRNLLTRCFRSQTYAIVHSSQFIGHDLLFIVEQFKNGANSHFNHQRQGQVKLGYQGYTGGYNSCYPRTQGLSLNIKSVWGSAPLDLTVLMLIVWTLIFTAPTKQNCMYSRLKAYIKQALVGIMPSFSKTLTRKSKSRVFKNIWLILIKGTNVHIFK